MKNLYVLIKKSAKNLSGYQIIAQINQYPLKVYRDSFEHTYRVFTEGLVSNNYNTNPFEINRKDTIEIDVTKYNKLKKKINESNSKLAKKQLYLKRIPIKNRKICHHTSKTLLSTPINFCKINNNNDISHKNGVVCCSFSKTSSNIHIYIPKSWLNYFGYTFIDLKNYLKFLEKCDINFKAKVIGVTTLKENFSITSNTNLSFINNNLYKNIEEDCYEVLLFGNNNKMTTYMHFVLIRFIYSNIYWNIPFIAMKLKQNLPKATYWDCLLIAHCTENYSGYYSLATNGIDVMVIPSKSNSAASILEQLKTVTYLNNCFRYYNNRYDNHLLRTSIENEDYNEIQKIIEKYKTL